MWDLLGGLGILAACILAGAWIMVRFMEEGERFDNILDVLPPREDHSVNAEDDPEENRLYWLTEKGWADE